MVQNKNGRTRKPRTPKTGAIHFKYRNVAPNQRRIIVRPYNKPPAMFYVSSGGVFVHRNFIWGKAVKAQLLAKGYSLQMSGSTMFVFSKTLGASHE
jgi:hypothetical protein